MLVNQAREQTRKLNEPSPSTLKLGSSARKQAREQARAYSFKTEPSRACLILGSTRLGYTPMCGGVGEDSRHEIRHVDIRVGTHMFYLNVCVCHCMCT